jgi:hypothetical protein
MGAAGIAAAVEEYLGMRRAVAMFLHGGDALPSGVTAITNMRTGTTYQYLTDAIYTGALDGDTILVPAGLAAPANPSIPYSYWRNTDSRNAGYVGGPGGFGNMYIGPGFTTGGAWSNASNASYLTIAGTGSSPSTNDRAVLSAPYCLVASDYTPGDTVLHVVDSSLLHPPSTFGTISLWVWGDGSVFTYNTFGSGMAFNFTGISGNTLTGVTVNGPPVTVPTGTTLFEHVNNGQAIFVAAAPNPGFSCTNLEMWGAQFGPGEDCNPVRQYGSYPGILDVGSVTFTNCYMHDCTQGPGTGSPQLGTNTFAHFFQTELFRMGGPLSASTHNAYIGNHKECIFDGSYSHSIAQAFNAAHLFKTRAITNFFTYSRISGEHTNAGQPYYDASNIDIANSGLTYIIGCALEQSTNASNFMIQDDNDGEALAPLFADNATREIYCINNTMLGPSNGTGWNGGSGPATGVTAGPISLWRIGLINPEMPTMGSSAAVLMVAVTSRGEV